MPPIKYIRYLLVFIDTLTGWIEVFPTNKRASTVATTVQQLTSYRVKMALPYPIPSTILWKSRKANHTLKNILTKLIQELQLDWIKLLPLARLRTRALPQKPLN
jgi:hypothetical protein